MSSVYSENYDKVVYSGVKKPKKGAEISLFLPPNLSINQLSQVVSGELNNVEPSKRKFHAKKVTGAALFYTYLFKNILYHGDRDMERWVQVSWQDCRTMLGVDYGDTIQRMVEANLLERLEANEDGVEHKHQRGHYWSAIAHDKKVGECKKYRIPAPLLSPDKMFTIRKEPAVPALVNKLEALTEPIAAIREQYREMALFNMSDIILVDCPESRAVLDQLYAQGNIQLTASDYLDLINHFPLEVPVICNFGHRAHHRIVRLHHSLRPWLRFRDDLDSEMVEIDIVASQPTILANITPRLIKKYAPECGKAIALFEKYSQKTDYKYYQKLCFDGQIYEYLRDEYNAAYPSQWVSAATRDDAKKMVFVAFFSNYVNREQAAPAETTENSLVKYLAAENQQQAEAAIETLFKKNSYALFKRLFPSLHALFTEIKALTWDFNAGQQHSNNCLLAQRVESGLVYTRFVKALVVAGITRFTTTHDAINVKKEDEAKARKIIQAEIKKAGLKMQLKTKVQEPFTTVVKALVQGEPETLASAPMVPVIDLLDNYQAPHDTSTLMATTDDWAEEILRRLAAHEQELSHMSDEDFFA
jgi:hypothetical protein